VKEVTLGELRPTRKGKDKTGKTNPQAADASGSEIKHGAASLRALSCILISSGMSA
jgi:hypothetical protein